MPTLSALVPQEVVIMTTYGATSESKFNIMTTFGVEWKYLLYSPVPYNSPVWYTNVYTTAMSRVKCWSNFALKTNTLHLTLMVNV